MPYFVLRAKEEVGYDCYDGFVVEADNEIEARKIAQENGGDEIQEWVHRYTKRIDVQFWINAALSTCEPIEEAGWHREQTGVILGSYNAG